MPDLKKELLFLFLSTLNRNAIYLGERLSGSSKLIHDREWNYQSSGRKHPNGGKHLPDFGNCNVPPPKDPPFGMNASVQESHTNSGERLIWQERALSGELDQDNRRRDLQLEAKAHVRVQPRWTDCLRKIQPRRSSSFISISSFIVMRRRPCCE
jgi:hypothetical protein